MLPGTAVERSEDGPFAFSLQTPDSPRKYVVRASCEEERKEWVDALAACAKSKSTRSPAIISIAQPKAAKMLGMASAPPTCVQEQQQVVERERKRRWSSARPELPHHDDLDKLNVCLSTE